MSDKPKCDVFSHDWEEEYYGFRCTRCGLFVPEDYFDDTSEHQPLESEGKDDD